MSLFSSLNLARLALGAQQAAIQTTGQNIANANTEGYARQRVQFGATPPNDLVFAQLGTGVRLERIERIVDEHLETTLRDARSLLANLGEHDRVIAMAESIFNDLEGGGLSAALGFFFESLEDLSNQPQDPTARSQMLEGAQSLAEQLRFLDAGLRALRTGLDEDIVGVTQAINRITAQVAELNRDIVLAEDGGQRPDTANDLRTRRDTLLGELSDLVGIRVIESSRGSVQVYVGSEALVLDADARTLEVIPGSDGAVSLHAVQVTETGTRLTPTSGRLGALLDGRDRFAVELGAELDTIALGLLRELNAVHAGGEGTSRLGFVRAAHAVVDRDAPLSLAGFPHPIENGTFSLQVINEGNGTRETFVVPVDLPSMGGGTSLADVVDTINTVVGAEHPEISARITSDGYLEIASSDESLTFTFRDDTSGLLTGAGVNVLFEGTGAADIDVAAALLANPALLATGGGAGSGDNTNVLALLELRDAGILGADGRTFEESYDALIGRVGVEGAAVAARLANQDAITSQLRNQREAISGVSIDEEAIQLVRHQRAFQGAARFLDIVDSLLETLLRSV